MRAVTQLYVAVGNVRPKFRDPIRWLDSQELGAGVAELVRNLNCEYQGAVALSPGDALETTVQWPVGSC